MAAYGSAISKYYVHYRAQSYIYNDREVNAKNSQALIEYARIKLQQSGSKLKSSISKTKKRKYLNAINALMARKNNLSTNDQQRANEAYKELEQMVLKKGSDYIVDRISGAVTKVVEADRKPAFQINDQKIAISQVNVEDFVVKFNHLTSYISSAIANGSINWKDSAFDGTLEDLQQLVLRLNQKVTEIKYLTSKELKNEVPQFFRNLTKAEKLKNLNWLILDNEWKNYIAQFNTLAQEYGLLFDTAKLLQGSHFENILGAAAELAFNTGVNSLIDNLANSVVGGDQVNAEFLMDGIDAKVWAKTQLGKQSNTIITTKNGVKVAVIPKYSQGKVDVILEYNRNILTKTGKPVTISAKSIKGLSEIGLVSKTTADALIDREENEYKKMYLNIMADHSTDIDNIFGVAPGSDQYYSLAKAESAALNILQSQRKDAILSFEILAAYKALTGDVLGRATAQLFIINDVNTQQIHLIEMADIINAIVSNLQQNAQNNLHRLFTIKSIPVWESVKYINTWVPGPDGEIDRVANLLNNLHAHKIEIALRGNQMSLKNMGMSINAKGKITEH